MKLKQLARVLKCSGTGVEAETVVKGSKVYSGTGGEDETVLARVL